MSIGDLRLELRGTPAVLSRLGKAFPACQPGADDVDVHTVTVWDGTSDAAPPPEPPWRAADYSPLGLVERFGGPALRFAFDGETSTLIAHDVERRASTTWYPDVAALPLWATAAPFRVVLSWLCNARGLQMIHAAAVARDDRAVLLVGRGGSGKSTTALACAIAGFDYLGDDYCAVDPEADCVHRIYRSAKASPSTIAMLPRIAPWAVADTGTADKAILFLDDGAVTLVPTARVASILLPRVGAGTATTSAPATRAEATHAILPSTVAQLMGGTAVTPRLILRLVQSVPAFHLTLGTDLGAVTDAIAEHLLASHPK